MTNHPHIKYEKTEDDDGTWYAVSIVAPRWDKPRRFRSRSVFIMHGWVGATIEEWYEEQGDGE